MRHKNQTSERYLHTTLLSLASIILILTLIATLAHSAEVELQWKSVAEADGYNVYFGTASRTYQAPDEILGQSQTTHSFTLDPGTYYFAVTAFNNYGESLPSTEVSATIEAPGINTYSVTASAGANGRISPSGVVSVSEGADQVFTISPNGGYKVHDVLVDGNSVGAVSSCSFPNVDADHTIEAIFSWVNIAYDVTASAGANGRISPSGVVSVSEGANQVFSISPNGSYEVHDVRVDGNSVGAVSSYSFPSVDADHIIEATFALAENEQTSPPVPDIKANGQDGPIYISSGEILKITVSLDPGIDYARKIVDWWIACLSSDDVWSSFMLAKKRKRRGWRSGIYSSNRAWIPLVKVSSYPVLWTKRLPPGDYTFYFAIDNNLDWNPDSMWSDAVEVHVQ